jgi:hypothetical protein
MREKVFFIVLMILALSISVIFLFIAQFNEISLGFRYFITGYQLVFYVFILVVSIFNLVMRKK